MAVLNVPVGGFDQALAKANPGDTLKLGSGDHGRLSLADRQFDPPVKITSAWYAAQTKAKKHGFAVLAECPTVVQQIDGERTKHGGFRIFGFRVDGAGLGLGGGFALDPTAAVGKGIVYEALAVSGAARLMRGEAGGPVLTKRCLFHDKPYRLIFGLSWDNSPAGWPDGEYDWLHHGRVETCIFLSSVERGLQSKPGQPERVPPENAPVYSYVVVNCTIMTSGPAFGDSSSMDLFPKEQQAWRIGCLMDNPGGTKGQWAGCVSRRGDPVPGRALVPFTLDANYRPVNPPPELLAAPAVPGHPLPTADFYGNPYGVRRVAGAVALPA